ncbi:hypothetical protein E1265_13430 [Streptomyces sp. 8K308]|uniref:hypothetical protein n=1 Tax=Streptomyces sp. 8K308 TaxID=2530388 RepID=UPI001049109C|nr:hypothetical protein [Streptomyces sp. 8K308]TDC23216.1 hypothetical protein E1265_13430 [Streptomyces sp. 8K308]
MPRPPDWSALNLGEDPTPGDPDELQSLIDSQAELLTIANEIDSGLTELMNSHSTTFKGKTADALRDLMDNRLRNYIDGFRDAHQAVQDALVTYRSAMIEQQGIADAALTAAQGLDEDDEEGRETQKGKAEEAREALESAAQTAGEALNSAAYDIPSPVDECAEFWKFLTFFAIALILPAIILGGPVALAALALNAALLVKTAIDFANGNASITELVLSIIGVLVPTTRGINITKIGSTFKNWGKTTFAPMKHMSNLGKFIYLTDLVGRGMLWVPMQFGRGIAWLAVSGFNGLRGVGHFTGFALDTLRSGWAANGLVGLGQSAINITRWTGSTALYRINNATGFGGYVVSHFRGFGPLAIIAPVNAAEMGRTFSLSGLGRAFNISLVNRGLANQFRTGAFVQGSNVIDIRAIRGFGADGLPIVDATKLARYQPGGFAGTQSFAGIAHVINLADAGRFGQGVTNGSGGFSMADLPSTQPISLHFAGRGLDIGISGMSGPGLGSNIIDMPSINTGLVGTAAPSVVVHVAGPGGQPVGIAVPLLPEGFAGGARTGDLTLTINMDGFTPIRVTYNQNGVSVTAATPDGRMPAFSLADMPRLGDMSLVPPGGISIPTANLNPAGITDAGVGQGLGNLPTTAPRLGGDGLALDLNLPSMPSLRLNFADQGMSMNMPDVSLTGANRPMLDLGPVETPSLQGLNTSMPALADNVNIAPPTAAQLDDVSLTGGLPDGVSIAAPNPGQLDVNLSNTNSFSINLGEGLQHSLNDAPTVTPGAQPPEMDVTVAPPAHAVTTTPVTATPPPVRATGAETASLGDITLNMNGVAPIRISSIEARPVGLPATNDVSLSNGVRSGDIDVPGGIRAADIPAPADAKLSATAPTNGAADTGATRFTEATDGPRPTGTGYTPPTLDSHLAEGVTATPQPVPVPLAARPETAATPPAPAPTPEKAVGGGGGGGRSVSDLFSGKLWDINPDLAIWRAFEELGLTRNAPPPSYFQAPIVNMVFTPKGSGALNSADDIPLQNLGSGSNTTTTNTAQNVANVSPPITQGAPLPGGSQTVNTPSQVFGPPPGNGATSQLGTPQPGPSFSSSSHAPTQGLGGAGPTSTPTPQPLGAQGAHSVSFRADGIDGVRFATSFDANGAVSQVQLVTGNGAPIQATRGGAGDPQGLFRAHQTLGGGVTRDLSFRVDGSGVRLVSMERTAVLTHARFGQANLRIDDLAAGGPTVTGATRPGNAPITVAPGATAGTVRLHQDLGGGLSRDWTVRITDAQPSTVNVHRNVDLGGFQGFRGSALRFDELAGGRPALTRADGSVVNNGVTGLGTHINGHHLVTLNQNRLVVDGNGAATHHVLRLPTPPTAVPAGRTAADYHLFAPINDAAGGATIRGLDGEQLAGVTRVPQQGGGTRLVGPGVHVSVDSAGTQLSRVVELTGHGGATRNVFVHTPVGGPANPAFRGADGSASTGVTHQPNGDFQQVAGNVTSTYNANGALIQDVVRHTRGPLVGQDVTVPNGASPRVGNTQGTAQGTTGTFRVAVPTGPHAIVNRAGELVGTATQFVGRNGVRLDAFGHLPVPPGSAAPALHAGNGAPIPAGTVRGGMVTLPNTHGGNTVHRYDGSLIEETFRVTGGPPTLNGHDLVVRQGNPTATITPVGGARPTASATVVEQFDQAGRSTGLRLDINGRGLAIDNHGNVTDDVFVLNQPGGPTRYAFVDVNNAATVGLRNAAGVPVPNVQINRLPGGELEVSTPNNNQISRFSGDGQFQFRDTRLPGTGANGADQYVRMRQFGDDFGRRSYELLDNQRVVIADRTVLPRPQTAANPNPGFRVNGDDGAFRLYRQDGHLDVSVGAPDATTNVRNVTLHAADGGAPTNLRVIELSNGVDSRYLDITGANALRLRGGELTPITTHGTIHTLPNNGGYRVDGHGARANEWQEYSPTGTMTAQRIDVFHQGRAVGNQHFLLDYRTNPDAPTWTRNTGAAGATAPRNPDWFDFGKVDLKGAERGHVSLLSHSGAPVFDRRVLPDGAVLDSHVAAPSLRGGNGVPYGRDSRDHWSEIRADGNIGDFGRRKWSVSGRAWVDYDNAGNPVRHFRENPQGGHVIADMRGMNAHYWSGSTSTWYRFDADYQQVASGTRTWSPGRAWIDRMPDAATGETKVVHQKISRVAGWGDIDHLRRYHAHDINTNGSWSPEWKGIAPTGKEVGSSTAMKNGDTLTVNRIAEQRPPNAWRSVLSSEFRGVNFGTDQARWAKDSRMQVARWEQSNGGTTVNHGIQFTSQHGHGVFRISHTGDFVGETRKITGGNELTVGDNVKLPDGVTLPNRYQPWSEGAGKLEGHRSFSQADFGSVHLPTGSGKTRNDVLFVDRFHVNRSHADPFTPTANAADWNIARVGFKDGTMLEYRPRPMERSPFDVGDDLDFRRMSHQGGSADWIITDPHAAVVARQDTFGLGDDAVQITSDGAHRWSGPNGTGGVRRYAATNDIHYRGWDRHSFQDFDDTGQLVREHRLLAEGVTLDAWRLPGDANHPPSWRWNKIGADGQVQRFGDQDVRIRRWYDDSGALLNDWKRGARWADHLDSEGAVRIQEIPAFARSGNPARDVLTIEPFRVREYVATTDGLDVARGADAYRAWKEHDAGTVVREIKRLSDGSFLETETWQKQWRRHVFGTNNSHTVVSERTIPGNIFQRDTFGTTHLVGRETHFIDFSNEFRGFTREWGESLRWSWGPSVTNRPGAVQGVESLYTPFLANNMGSVAVALTQEFALDFLLNLTVFGIVSAATGTPFTITDVQQAAFNAAISAGVKSISAGLHNWGAHHGTWKVGFGNKDQGYAYNFRQNDDAWASEWAGNEKVLRWRGGTYDFFLGAGVGGLAGFASGAAGAAIFGVKDSEGNRHHLSGGDAAFYGLAGMLGGLAGGFSIGALRGMMQNTMAARLYHRAGVIDFLVMPVIGKLIDKSVAAFWLGPEIRASLGITAPQPPPQPGPDPQPNP